MIRPQKTWRISYWGVSGDQSAEEAAVSILGDPGEVRLGVGGKSFLSVKEDGVTLSGGFPSKVNIQGMSNSFKFAGMLQNLRWPLSMMPGRFPQQTIVPPLVEELPTIQQVASIATSIAGF